MDMGRVSGKIAIVTGGASGMGAATARMLACEGALVVIADRNIAMAQDVAESITQAGGTAMAQVLDVADETSWQACIDATLAAFGALDVLVNAAGIGAPFGSVEDLSLEDWRLMMSVNSDGVFLGTQKAIAAIRATRDRGSIINFSSTMGIVASPSTAAYVASKGAVRMFTKSAALHCAKSGYNIRVNSIHPGWIRTPMSQGALDELAKSGAGNKAIDLTPLGRVGEPDDIAYGVLFLASDESSFMTGAELVIDGGYTAQ